MRLPFSKTTSELTLRARCLRWASPLEGAASGVHNTGLVFRVVLGREGGTGLVYSPAGSTWDGGLVGARAEPVRDPQVCWTLASAGPTDTG